MQKPILYHGGIHTSFGFLMIQFKVVDPFLVTIKQPPNDFQYLPSHWIMLWDFQIICSNFFNTSNYDTHGQPLNTVFSAVPALEEQLTRATADE
jgi:hypothetical protein